MICTADPILHVIHNLREMRDLTKYPMGQVGGPLIRPLPLHGSHSLITHVGGGGRADTTFANSAARRLWINSFGGGDGGGIKWCLASKEHACNLNMIHA